MLRLSELNSLLISRLCSGDSRLITEGPRFGGALNHEELLRGTAQCR